MVIKGNSYDCCSACSKKITSTYQSEGWHFIKRALNERGYVERLSGLAEVGQLIRIVPRSANVLYFSGLMVYRFSDLLKAPLLTWS